VAVALDSSSPSAVSVATGSAVPASFTAPAGAVIVVVAAMAGTSTAAAVGSYVYDTAGSSWLRLGYQPPTATTAETVMWATIARSRTARTVTVVGAADNSHAKFVQVLVFTGADLSATFPQVVTGVGNPSSTTTTTTTTTSSSVGNYYGGDTDVNNTTAYPNSVIMPSALPIPAGAVRIPAGSNIASAASSHGAGTVFVLDAGTYSGGYTVVPNPGQQFYGQGAGKTILSNIQIHRGSSATTNIGIFNLTLRDVGPNTSQRGAIDSCFSENQTASGWHVANCEITNNYIGIQLGPNFLLENCTLHHNGGKAIGDGEQGSVIRYNQFFNNLTPGANNYYDSGADDSNVKMALQTGATWIGNLISHGNPSGLSSRTYGGIGGHGVWQDVSCGINPADRTGSYPSFGNVYDSNIIYSNCSAGICDETGGNNVFKNNLIVGNAHGVTLDGFRICGLAIQSSNHDTVQNNYIWNNGGNSVIIYMDQYGGDRSDANRSKNNSVIGNTIDVAPIQQTGQWSGGSGNNTISGNTVVPGFSGVKVPTLLAGPQATTGTGTGGGGGTPSGPTALMAQSMTCTRTGSQMWAVYADTAGGAAPTLDNGARYSAIPGGMTGAVLDRTGPFTAGNTMAISTTAPYGNISWLAFEIVPAVSTGGGGGGTGGSGIGGGGIGVVGSTTWPQVVVEAGFGLDPTSPLTYPPIIGDSATFARSIGKWKNSSNAYLILGQNFAPAPYRNCLLVTAQADGDVTVNMDTGAGTIVPGVEYTITLRLRSGLTPRSGLVEADWKDATGSTLINYTQVAFTDSATGWTTVTVTSTPGSTASRLVLLVAWSGMVAGEQHEVAGIESSTAYRWTDISRYVRGLDLARSSRQYELGRFEAGTASIVVDNTGGRFDSNNPDGPYYPDLEPIVPIRVKALWLGSTYPLWSGFVERWPQTWSDPALSEPTITCVDSLAALSQGTLRTTYEQEVLLDGPVSFYPLNEPQSASGGGDVISAGSLAVVQSPTAGGGFSHFGGQSIIFDGAAALYLNPTPGTSPPYTTDILNLSAANDANFLGGPYSFDLFFGQDGTTTPSNAPLFCQLDASGAKTGIEIVVGRTVAQQLTLYVGGTKVYESTGGILLGGNFGNYVCVTVSVFGVVTLYAGNYANWLTDGTHNYLWQGAVSGFGNQVAHTVLGGDWIGTTATGNFYNGYVSHVAFYNKELTYDRVNAHWAVGVHGGYPLETTGSRVQRLLNYWGWPANYRSVMSGWTYAGSAGTYGLSGLSGQSALDALQDQGEAEHGQVYSLADGTPVFEDRKYRPSQVLPVNVFDPYGDLPYQLDGLEVDNDPTYIYNQVTITRDGGAVASVSDATSVRKHFPRTYSATIKTQFDEDAADRAQLILRQYSTPRSRLAAFTVEPSANPNVLFAPTLAMDISDLNRVWVRPVGAPAWSFDGYVDALSHSIVVEPGSQSWTVTCQLSPVLPD